MRLQIGRWPVRLRWDARHESFVRDRQFRDIQQRGPFARWVHTHRFLPDGEYASVLEDEVDFRLPLGLPGLLGGNRWVRGELERLFRHRHEQTRSDLNRHARHAQQRSQRVAVSGAGGLVGSRLCAFLTSGGHHVHRLRRGQQRVHPTDILWHPERQHLQAADLDGVDVVVHLAGESIADGRWNPGRKAAIRDSRVEGTRLLCRTLAQMPRKPRVLISASAVGYYGDGGTRELDERADGGDGFLADVCREWEAATAPAREAGIRVVNLRIGMVLAGEGGALAKMLPAFRLGLGGPVGGGRQYQSWIAIEDLVGAIQHLMFADDVEGPVNATAPNPVTNADFTRTLGQVLRRPTLLPLPAFAVRAALGEMGEELLLVSQRVVPHRLQESGFAHLFPTPEPALRSELGRFRRLSDAI